MGNEILRYRQPTLEEYRGMGLGRYIVDRSTHPLFYVSSWNPSHGLLTQKDDGRHSLPNLNYNSVMVIVLSNEYSEGVWWRLQNMLRYTEERGYLVAFDEMDDMSTMPADAIGIMRACAAKMALDAGFEWCFMVDTDVRLEEDTFVRLVKHERPVVFPFLNILEDKTPGPVTCPIFAHSHAGLQPVRWAAMSCMLFNTKVFNCLDHYAWHGHDQHFSQSLGHYGHRIYVDTDTVVDVVRGPSRHPAKTWDELWASIKGAYERRQNQERDRRPPPDFDPAFGKGTVDKDGVYWAVEQWKNVGVRGQIPKDGSEEPENHDAKDSNS